MAILNPLLNPILNPVLRNLLAKEQLLLPAANEPPAILKSADCLCWFEAEYYKTDNSNITFGSGNFVTEIYDRNGNPPLYRQNTTNKQPEYIANAINNRAALKFDNSDDGMLGVNIPEIFSNYSIIAVYSPLNSNSIHNNRFI